MENKEMNQEIAAEVNAELADEALGDVAGGGLSNRFHTRIMHASTPCFNGQYEKGYARLSADEFEMLRSDNKELRQKWFQDCQKAQRSPYCCGICYNLEFESETMGYCGKE